MDITRPSQTNLQNPEGVKPKKLWIKILNIAGPIAGFTAALSPLALLAYQRQPQHLPIEASFVSNHRTIGLEVARTPQELSKGLKFRNSIKNNQGMLFLLKQPEKVQLWMKNTYIPLDMIFLNDGVIKSITKAAPPCKSQTCPTYSSIYPVNQVIELRAGSTISLNLKVGNQLPLTFKTREK